MFNFLFVLFFCFLSSLSAGYGGYDRHGEYVHERSFHRDLRPTVVDILNETEGFSIFLQLLSETNLIGELIEGGPYTIFAPIDEAFDAFPEGELERLLEEENREELLEFLQSYVISGVVRLEGEEVMEWESLSGGKLIFIDDGEERTVNGVRVVLDAMDGSNGVVHVIDGILIR